MVTVTINNHFHIIYFQKIQGCILKQPLSYLEICFLLTPGKVTPKFDRELLSSQTTLRFLVFKKFAMTPIDFDRELLIEALGNRVESLD